MAKGYFIIDNKYVIETQTASELMYGMVSSILTLNDGPPSAQTWARLLTEEIGAAGGTMPEIRTYTRIFNPYPYKVIEIDTKNETVYDDGTLERYDELRG